MDGMYSSEEWGPQPFYESLENVLWSYLIAVPRVDGVRECACTGDTCPADVGLIGLGAEIEAIYLAQIGLVVVGTFR